VNANACTPGEADRFAILCGSQDEVKIAGMKTKNDFSRGGLKHCALLTDLQTPT